MKHPYKWTVRKFRCYKDFDKYSSFVRVRVVAYLCLKHGTFYWLYLKLYSHDNQNSPYSQDLFQVAELFVHLKRSIRNSDIVC